MQSRARLYLLFVDLASFPMRRHPRREKKKLARLRNALSRKHAKYATRACVCIHVCVSTYMRARKSSSLVTARDHRPRACSKFVPREVSRGRPKVFRNDCVLTPEFSTSLAYIYGILTCPSLSLALLPMTTSRSTAYSTLR